MVQVSSLGLSTQSIFQIRNAQEQLSSLSLQLSTGKKSSNYADYALTDVRRILDFRSVIEKRNSFQDVINTVKPRMDVYSNTLTALGRIGNEMLGIINSVQNPDNAQDAAVGEQVSSFMQQVEFFLNQKVGDRYIFSGTRYGTAPVGDLSALAVPPVDSSTPVSSPTLPTYDSQAPGTDANAYTKATATIDDGYTITYGITSNESGLQRLVLGMRWAYAASQDSANYTSYMNTARGLITTALDDIRTLEGNVTSNLLRVGDMKQLHAQFINESKAHIADIQNADSAEVATKLTYVQAQLQASYSATAKIASLSLTQYL